MSTLGSTTPVLRDSSEVRRYLWADQGVVSLVLSSADTGGQFVLLDEVGHRGSATPLHVHYREDETFYVLEGAIRACAGDLEGDFGAGSALFLPRGIPHAFMVTSETARIATICTPGGLDQFVEEAGIAVDGDLPTTWDFDLERYDAPAERIGVEILGPPPFEL